jgi:UDP-N-acetylmuramoyl-tripeptide--D-alanyl-D-alanine ligase
LEVLHGFGGAKIIVTPGFVEMGAEREAANAALGADIAAFADYAFLTGPNAPVIRDGAIAAGMPEDRAVIVSDLAAAVARLGDIGGEKAVLFENDLPDNIV